VLNVPDIDDVLEQYERDQEQAAATAADEQAERDGSGDGALGVSDEDVERFHGVLRDTARFLEEVADGRVDGASEAASLLETQIRGFV